MTRRPIWGYSVCLEEFHRKIEYNSKIISEVPKNESGLAQMITMGKSIRPIWVNEEVDGPYHISAIKISA